MPGSSSDKLAVVPVAGRVPLLQTTWQANPSVVSHVAVHCHLKLGEHSSAFGEVTCRVSTVHSLPEGFIGPQR
jgi:predicted metal-dependent hydrolase